MIVGPVSIYDVQQCFGTSRNDLGNQISNLDINRWAKYKPVKFKPVVGIKVDVMTAQNSTALCWIRKPMKKPVK